MLTKYFNKYSVNIGAGYKAKVFTALEFLPFILKRGQTTMGKKQCVMDRIKNYKGGIINPSVLARLGGEVPQDLLEQYQGIMTIHTAVLNKVVEEERIPDDGDSILDPIQMMGYDSYLKEVIPEFNLKVAKLINKLV